MGLPTEENLNFWRYISFARFVWLLQNKKLWLSRADLLGDPWEISLAGNQLDPVIARHPITPLGQTVPQENAIDRSKRIIKLWREKTFVSCWSASDHENHALWRIYCQTSEGVAIQTTQAQMKISIGELPLYKVIYEQPGDARRTPTIQDLLTKKRTMFAYEQEMRIVRVADERAHQEDLGYALDWDPEKHAHAIKVHPEADSSFMETVIAVVEQYASKLKGQVSWSAMREPPPF